MSKHGAVGVRHVESGKVTICAAGGIAGYHTLCGTSLDDAEFERAPIAVNAKVECPQCFAIWQLAHTFKRNNFK